ncbi:phosphotyrosine protein phosphatase I superfamily [Gautieria morchelliformis]|nr:phosphotyrosine protein phosphatase I superfamily [Gautieria morchelliformis]
MTKVTLICIPGNICRSPMGEAVLAHQVKERGLDIKVDSAGTAGYHVGEVETCRKHGTPISHAAQQVSPGDFRNFTHILAADKANLANLERMKPADATATVRLWGSYDDGKSIEDPYYGGIDGFEKAYMQCLRYSNSFLDQLHTPEHTTSAV